MLHDAEVRLSQDPPTGEICRSFGITATSHGTQNYGGECDYTVAKCD
jgi:hypothetical protein